MTSIELSAIGIQDKYININPQISFFKTVFRRHTNFSKVTERIENSSKAPTFGSSDLEFIIPQRGDLLNKLYFEVIIAGQSDTAAKHTVNHFGNSLIKTVALEIGGITIDTHSGRWLQIYSELYDKSYKYPRSNQSQTDSTNGGLNDMVFAADATRTQLDITRRMYGDCPLVFGGVTNDGTKDLNKTYYKKFYVPLRFFFNNSLAQSLPMCALSNHQVKIKVTLESVDNLRGNLDADDLSIHSFNLYGDFIHLANEERSKFVNTALTYLIETVQEQGDTVANSSQQRINDFTSGYNNPADKIETGSKEYALDSFKHPIKYFTWVVNNPGTSGSNPGMGPCYFMSLCSNSEYGNDGIHGSFLLKLDNREKESILPMSHYTRKIYCELGIKVPELDRIGLYSFAAAPFDEQPSGTCNFSKISDVNLNIIFANDALVANETIIKNKNVYFFAVNYNVLRIMNGMAGLEFS